MWDGDKASFLLGPSRPSAPRAAPAEATEVMECCGSRAVPRPVSQGRELPATFLPEAGVRTGADTAPGSAWEKCSHRQAWP